MSISYKVFETIKKTIYHLIYEVNTDRIPKVDMTSNFYTTKNR